MTLTDLERTILKEIINKTDDGDLPLLDALVIVRKLRCIPGDEEPCPIQGCATISKPDEKGWFYCPVHELSWKHRK